MTSPRVRSCDGLSELLAVYALDAVEADEAALVSNHLRSCPRCAQEVDEYRETIALLAASGGDAPEQVWGRISSAIGADQHIPLAKVAPVLRAPTSPRRRRPATAWAAVAAVAASLVAVFGFQASRINQLDQRVEQITSASRQSGGFQGLAAALVDPTARHYKLVSTAGKGQALGQLIILPSGASYMVDSRMPALPASQTYQLWSATGGRLVSVGLLGSHPGNVAFTVDTAVPASAYMVTVEPAGGVVAPTGPPVARATV